MMELLLKRRSTRNFTDQNVEPEKVEKLLQAALLSPTAENLFSCEFILVEEKKTLRKLSAAKPHGGIFLANAALGIIVIGNSSTTDVWVEDASIAAINIQLEAESLGLGSCWVQIRSRKHSENLTAGEYIKQQLNIPGNYEVEAIIAIGYKASASKSHTLDTLDRNRIHKENFQNTKSVLKWSTN